MTFVSRECLPVSSPNFELLKLVICFAALFPHAHTGSSGPQVRKSILIPEFILRITGIPPKGLLVVLSLGDNRSGSDNGTCPVREFCAIIQSCTNISLQSCFYFLQIRTNIKRKPSLDKKYSYHQGRILSSFKFVDFYGNIISGR